MRKTGRHTSFAPKGGTPRDERALPDRTDTAPAPPERGAYDRKAHYAILGLRPPWPCRGWKPARHPHALRASLSPSHGVALAALRRIEPVSVTFGGLVRALHDVPHELPIHRRIRRARAVAGAKRRRNPADYFRTPRAWTLSDAAAESGELRAIEVLLPALHPPGWGRQDLSPTRTCGPASSPARAGAQQFLLEASLPDAELGATVTWDKLRVETRGTVGSIGQIAHALGRIRRVTPSD